MDAELAQQNEQWTLLMTARFELVGKQKEVWVLEAQQRKHVARINELLKQLRASQEQLERQNSGQKPKFGADFVQQDLDKMFKVGEQPQEPAASEEHRDSDDDKG